MDKYTLIFQKLEHIVISKGLGSHPPIVIKLIVVLYIGLCYYYIISMIEWYNNSKSRGF